MFIDHLQLKNFRNYKELELLLDKQINIFYGNNAQGKTNILEAIYLLALTKSHRNSKEKELVHWGQSFSVIKGHVRNNRSELQLEVQLSSKGKKVKINNLEKKKLSDYIGAINVVIFGPEDLTLVKGSPQNRRKFLDIEIGQVSPSYVYHLTQYQKIMQQRNNLLKDFTVENKNKIELLEVWDAQLIEYGAKVIFKRIKYIDKLSKWSKSIHSNITNKNEDLRIKYKSSIPIDLESITEDMIKDQFHKQIQKNRKQEIYRGTTLIGPHRDDLEFFINDIDVQSFGSQGQQRTTALSLKLAEIELIFDEIGDYPILLLDDVLSELDNNRQTHLIKTIEDRVQTIITTTNTEGIDFKDIHESSLFYVEEGTVTIKRD